MKRVTVAFALLLLLLSAVAVAQEQTTSLEGVITDASGSVLPGVTVEAVSTRGQHFSTVSDKEGHYRFPSVPPGQYTVTATIAGMQTATLRNVDVRSQRAPKADLKMSVASVTEAITVSAEAPIVDVTSSAAQSSIRTETFEQLPRGRDFASVVTMAPSANLNNKTGGISIDGASGAENRYIMDGVDTTNPQTGVQGKVLVTSFVDEVQVKSAGYRRSSAARPAASSTSSPRPARTHSKDRSRLTTTTIRGTVRARISTPPIRWSHAARFFNSISPGRALNNSFRARMTRRRSSRGSRSAGLF